MGARGPRPGSGEISAWIVEALRASPKNRHELGMGSGFTPRQIEKAVDRMLRLKSIVPATDEGGKIIMRPGLKNQPGTVYQLAETKIANHIYRRARRRSSNPARALDDAFHGIVGRRLPSP